VEVRLDPLTNIGACRFAIGPRVTRLQVTEPSVVVPFSAALQVGTLFAEVVPETVACWIFPLPSIIC
jgi:hypothetical protein